MSRINRIHAVLSKELTVLSCDISDQSHLHSRHYDAKGQSETHLTLHLKAQEFNTMTRVQRHRLVNQLLAAEFENGLHALTLHLES